VVNNVAPLGVLEVFSLGWVHEMRTTKVKKDSTGLNMRIFCVMIMFKSLEFGAKIVKISKNLLFYRYLDPKLLHHYAINITQICKRENAAPGWQYSSSVLKKWRNRTHGNNYFALKNIRNIGIEW
jgi:hypothetical protein